jgi:DNA-directed RNA polymerase subunit N (RpoN/RPB10)
MSCGKMIGDKWVKYSEELAARRPPNAEQRFYMDGTSIPRTLEYELLDKYNLKRPCCRKHFLTHVDLITKI